MARTYKAILQGDRIEWLDGSPSVAKPTPVDVTLLEDKPTETSGQRGREMARALETLAKAGGLSGISDPAAWQREVRQDRSLPRREP